MKTVSKSILFAVALAGLSSCGNGGWTKTQEAEFLAPCEANGSYDCQCALEKTKKKYPNSADFNAKAADDMELAADILKSCSK